MTTKNKKSTIEKFKDLYGDLEESPLERLRFFCSLALNSEDWLDCEKFFDDLEQELNK